MIKKSQAAMEFLMTYGWAILILMLVIASLFGLGIFNPSSPNNCISITPITCNDIKIDEYGNLEVSLSTSDTENAVITEVRLNNPSMASCTFNNNGFGNSIQEISLDIPTSYFCVFLLTDPLKKGQKFDGIIDVHYILSGGNPTGHDVNLKFSGTIE